VRDGLGCTERQLLEAVDAGAATLRDAFVEHNRREDPIWLGDLSFAGYAEALASGAHPLPHARSWGGGGGAEGRARAATWGCPHGSARVVR
jgi:hypothetical protein